MLVKELPLQSLPHLQLTDNVHTALQLMNDTHVAHLPIANGEKYIGIISEDELLQVENELDSLSEHEQSFQNNFVKEEDHFLKALQIAADNSLSLIPVVSGEQELLGAISYSDLIKNASGFMSLNEPGALLVLEMEPHQYSFQEINRLIESNDAQITQLNTSHDQDTGLLQVTIRINKPDISDILTTFQRYEYNVKHHFGEELYANDLRNNYDNLMNYLKI